MGGLMFEEVVMFEFMMMVAAAMAVVVVLVVKVLVLVLVQYYLHSEVLPFTNEHIRQLITACSIYCDQT